VYTWPSSVDSTRAAARDEHPAEGREIIGEGKPDLYRSLHLYNYLYVYRDGLSIYQSRQILTYNTSISLYLSIYNYTEIGHLSIYLGLI